MATRAVPILRINQVTGAIVSAAMKVHSVLGPGLLESAYQACLAQELQARGLHVASQVGLPVVYEGERLELGYRIDLLSKTSWLSKSSVWRQSIRCTRRNCFLTCG